ncbi:DAACS family dicarboxylate/amino acid:cation (Na+ or H+) symporter [Caldanaerobacter subterraneus subsp. tengcongensis MB4]|uniref:Na+/H+-dicarboxylate symporters n=2 Tax=Caldanaerobacter subterraneus TaxID=911092 RepID=Q8RAJ9_CALS4|nr:Na+/H+-dicarboxylate symporters [Caldanaerobacter subterraneus subsp. tengcongensis MB4]MCS3915998.1 DAACS family dicarboxylate/amino acid:cation (Na+ or H+) symporter [Caldanaerobacter subterraneus subsp. tengcongensis MB4]
MKDYQKLLTGFILGIIVGLICYYTLPIKTFPFMQWAVDIATLIGAIFLRLIFMAVIPLLTSALILGVFELSQGRALGKVAVQALVWTIVLSTIAVAIGLIGVNVVKPGVGTNFDIAAAEKQSIISITQTAETLRGLRWYQYIVNLLPQNPIESAAKALQGEIIAVMVFAAIFGWAVSIVIKEENHSFIQVMQAIFEASMGVVKLALKMAPYAIFCIVFNTTYKMGAGFLKNLGVYAAVVVVGLAIQLFVVYPFFLKVFAKKSPGEFFRGAKEPMLYAFSTSSSNATLPISLKAAEEELKLPPHIARFILTIGATANQNGTALFEGVTILFLAQVYGVDLSLSTQLLVMFAAILAGVGTAGVPAGSLPVIAALLAQVGVPPEGIGLILGIDRFLDMCRTTLNVTGDLVIAELVTTSSGERGIPTVSTTQS